MDSIVYNVLFFLILFTITYVVFYLTSLKKLKKKKIRKIEWINYLVKKFNLDLNNIKPRRMIFTTSLINAFIISLVSTLITMVDMNYMWKIMGGFVLIFGLIYSLYEIYGRYLVSMERKDLK